jgi:ABC-type sugar transport system substrate-binding protein
MKLATQHIMRIAAVLALTAASASAFAQSDEYRRGYAEGYAAGQRAGNDGGNSPGWGRVRVEEAEYGVRGAMCDARRAVRNEVERNNGNVRAGNELCGDPAPRQEKRLRIVYRCGDSEPVRVSLRENESTRLSCRR